MQALCAAGVIARTLRAQRGMDSTVLRPGGTCRVFGLLAKCELEILAEDVVARGWLMKLRSGGRLVFELRYIKVVESVLFVLYQHHADVGSDSEPGEYLKSSQVNSFKEYNTKKLFFRLCCILCRIPTNTLQFLLEFSPHVSFALNCVSFEPVE